jgi:RHS repeat-associated protein
MGLVPGELYSGHLDGGDFDESPYGSQVIQQGSDASNFGFQGSYVDSVTGLVFMLDRYYDPSTDQFISVDPDVAVTGQPYASPVMTP